MSFRHSCECGEICACTWPLVFGYYCIRDSQAFKKSKNACCDSCCNKTSDMVWCCYSKNVNNSPVYCSAQHCCGKRKTPAVCQDTVCDYFTKLFLNIVGCPILPFCSPC